MNELQSSSYEQALINIGVRCFYCTQLGHVMKNCTLLKHGKDKMKEI